MAERSVLAERIRARRDDVLAAREAGVRTLTSGALVAEWALLRDGLLQAWETEPDGITPAEIRRMDAELDHALALAAIEYARALRAGAPEARASEPR